MVLLVRESPAARSASQAGVTIKVERPPRSTTTALSPTGRTPAEHEHRVQFQERIVPEIDGDQRIERLVREIARGCFQSVVLCSHRRDMSSHRLELQCGAVLRRRCLTTI